jgi:hypothetical protein
VLSELSPHDGVETSGVTGRDNEQSRSCDFPQAACSLTPLPSCAAAVLLSQPELSALLEEDEEGDETRGATGSGDEAESEGVAMELTGNTMHTPAGPAAAAAAVAASEGATPDFASESCWGQEGGKACSGRGGSLF